MAPNSPYIGCTLSLLTSFDIRFEGVLYNIDKENSTIALAKVRSFGTEDRMTAVPVAGQDKIYEYIVFKAAHVKELIVCKTPEKSPALQNGLPEDPAIISYSKHEIIEKTSPKSPLLAALHSSSPTTTYARVGTPLSSLKGRPSRLQALGKRPNQLISLSDPGLRYARGQSAFLGCDASYPAEGYSAFSSNGRPVPNCDPIQFKADYDFEAANREFDKLGGDRAESVAAIAIKEELKSMVKSVLVGTQEEAREQEECRADGSEKSFYNKKASFFDSISSGNKQEQNSETVGQQHVSGFKRYSLDSRPLPNYFGLPEYELSYRQQQQRRGNNVPVDMDVSPRF